MQTDVVFGLFSRWSSVSLLTFLLCACAAPPEADPALLVMGSATYRERITLPPQAVFEATIEDVSRVDAASVRIGQVRIDSPQVPVRFSIPVDVTKVRANGRYVVRAQIALEGRLLYTSDTAHPVLGPSGTKQVDILMRRVGVSPEVSEPKRMQGVYTYIADSALFVDCAGGQRLPVAEAGDNAALQRAYAASRPSPGAAMLATVDGRVSTAAPVESGGAPRAVLVVERFIAIGAGPCGTPHGTAMLENTYWKLVLLDGKPVAAGERQREPHFILQQQQQRITGSSGCNRLVGGYTLKDSELAFSRSAGTLMMCPQGMELERAFLVALAATARWRIVADQLDLMDAAGSTLARFEAVFLR